MCIDCQENSSTLPKGDKGDTGASGTNGSNGATWYTSSGIPSNGLGVDNDDYLDLNTYSIYNKQAGVWVLVGNIKGIDGTGLIKFAITYNTLTPIAGVATKIILGTFLSTYTIPSTSSPGVAPAPFGQTYGTEKTDFILVGYTFNGASNTWNTIPASQISTSTNATTGDVTITFTGVAVLTPYRIVLIG